MRMVMPKMSKSVAVVFEVAVVFQDLGCAIELRFGHEQIDIEQKTSAGIFVDACRQIREAFEENGLDTVVIQEAGCGCSLFADKGVALSVERED